MHTVGLDFWLRFRFGCRCFLNLWYVSWGRGGLAYNLRFGFNDWRCRSGNRHGRSLGSNGRLRNRHGQRCRNLLRDGGLRVRGLVVFNGVFLQKAEDIVEDEISVRLLGKEERLDEFPPWLAVVGHFTNDLNDYTTVRGGLRIDRVDEDLAVLETNRCDFRVNFLSGRAR